MVPVINLYWKEHNHYHLRKPTPVPIKQQRYCAISWAVCPHYCINYCQAEIGACNYQSLTPQFRKPVPVPKIKPTKETTQQTNEENNYMRDINRIDKFCNRLAEAWKEKAPDMRFGQFIINIFNKLDRDPWYLEEDEMIKFIENIKFNTTK